MRTTDGTATRLAADPQASRRRGRRGERGVIAGLGALEDQSIDRRGRRGDERGIIALEWLLIVGAIAGLAASSVLIVQRVVDDTSEVPVDPLVLVLEADIAAAFVVAEADAAALSPPYIDQDFRERCDVALPAAFGDVVDTAVWKAPELVDPPADPGDPPTLAAGATCKVTPLEGLGD